MYCLLMGTACMHLNGSEERLGCYHAQLVTMVMTVHLEHLQHECQNVQLECKPMVADRCGCIIWSRPNFSSYASEIGLICWCHAPCKAN